MRNEKAFGGIRAYEILLACPCKDCDIRGFGCGKACDAYKKYKFVLAVLNRVRQAKAQKTRASRAMRDDRIFEWRHNGRWPKG